MFDLKQKLLNAKVNLFVDLEETLIDNWHNGRLLYKNIEFVKRILASECLSGFHVFSFAIWNKVDQCDFEWRIKRPLERALESSVLTFPSVEDMMLADTQRTGLHWGKDVNEFVLTRGKQGAFESWCSANYFQDTCNILVDDAVPNKFGHTCDTNHTLVFIDITKQKGVFE